MATRNIVPRANEEGNIGTLVKNWLKGWFKDLFVSGNITDGSNDASVANLKDAVDKKHVHSNLSALDNVTKAGAGTQYLADDGTYKVPVGAGDMLKSVYDTNNNGIVDKAEKLSQYEVFYSAVDYGQNFGSFRVRAVGGSAQQNFTFHIPKNFNTLIKLVAVGIIESGAAASGKDIDLTSTYGNINEVYNIRSESNTSIIYDFTGKTNQIVEIDISSVFTIISAGNYCGININHHAIGGNINYLGIKLVYS